MPRSQESIAERRLRHVYDNIDLGLNKKAIQEADKVLKKHPETPGAKSLKALALIRLGRVEDAEPILDEVETGVPSEDHVLTALTHCFKDLNRPDRIAAMYAKAVEKDPKNEDMLAQLFLAYVRVGDFRLCAQTGTQLGKLRSTSLHYRMWTVISLLLQGDQQPALASKMFYPMAEKLLQASLKDNQELDRESELLVYLLVLERQKKYAGALELIQSGPSEKLAANLWDRDYRVLELLCKLEKWDEAADSALSHLETKPDDWRMYEILLDATITLAVESPERQSEVVSRAEVGILGRVEAEKGEGGSHRGPFLARLALIQRLLERELVVRAQLGEPLDLLVEYFVLFGVKPSCFADIRPYLSLLGEQQQDEFLDHVWSKGKFPRNAKGVYSDNIPQNAGEMWRHLCCVRLSSALGKFAALAASEKVELATHLVSLYRHGVALEPELRSSEMRVGDRYLEVASSLVWDLYLDSAESTLLLGLAAELTLALAASPVNFNLKMALAKIYSAVGATKVLLRYARSLDIKYIQMESLGYLVNDQLSQYGSIRDLLSWLSDLERWAKASERETADCVVSGFRAGKLPNIPEILSFQRKLQLSFNRRASDVARAYFHLLTGPTEAGELGTVALPGDEALDLSDVTDNRDLDVFPTAASHQAQLRLAAHRDTSLQETLDVARLRHLILRIFSLTRELGQEGAQDLPPRLRTLLSQLKAHHRHCRDTYIDLPKPPLEGVMASNFHVYLEGSYLDILFAVVEVVASIAESSQAPSTSKGDSQNGDGPAPIIKPIDFQDLFRRMVACHQVGSTAGSASPVPSPHFPFLQLVHLSYSLQTLAASLLLAHLALPLLPKKKKRAQTNGDSGNSRAEDLKALVSVARAEPPVIAQLIGDLKAINDSDLPTFNINSEPFFLRPPDEREEVETALRSVRSELRASYAASLEEMSSMVTHVQRIADNLYKAAS